MASCGRNKAPGLRWSELPPEILDLIMQRLALADCFTFGKVCISWRSVFLYRCHVCSPPPCMMVILSENKHISRAQLFGLVGDKLVRLCSPKLNLHPSENVVGSSMGWLVSASRGSPRLRLLNPISKQEISLSSTASGGLQMCLEKYGVKCFNIFHVVLSSDPTSHDCILVASGFTLYDPFGLAWCRVGDREWTTLTSQELFECQTVFHDGELYVLNKHGDITIYSFDPQQKITSKSVTPRMITTNVYCSKLVESTGVLLLVVHHWEDCDSNDGSRIIDIFSLVEERWEVVESLGDQFLLIGNAYAKSICTQGLMGSSFEPNCIYYPSLNYKILYKYSIADGNLQKINLPVEINHLAEVEWILPQAW